MDFHAIMMVVMALALGALGWGIYSIHKRFSKMRAQLDHLLREQKDLKVRSQLDRLLREQKDLKACIQKSQDSSGGPKLNDVHRALAGQITLAGEILDRKISQVLQALHDNNLLPSGKHPSEAPLEPTLSQNNQQHIIREFSVIKNGLESAPERYLNLVHGIPKAGNTTLLASLWASNKVVDGAMSSHFLSATAMRDLRLGVGQNIGADQKQVYDRSLRFRKILGELGYLNDWLRPADAPEPTRPLRVICPFRDPVASALSLGAYNRSLNLEILSSLKAPPIKVNPPLSKGEDPCHPEYFASWMSAWVEEEILNLYGIDLFDIPFDHDLGFGILRTDRYHLLILTLESASRFPEALAELYGSRPDDIHIVKGNEASARTDAAAYHNFVHQFRITRSMAERIYDTPLLRYLYSQEQLDQFISRWTA